MRRVLILLPLLLGGCSCQRQNDTEVSRGPATAAAQDAAPAAAQEDTAAADRVPLDALAALDPAADTESSTVRLYVTALLQGNREAVARYWHNDPGPRPDDRVLRELPNVTTLRIETYAPIARDTAVPSRLREVPITIRANTSQGTLRFTGWYRLVPAADHSGWQIHSASIQPVLR